MNERYWFHITHLNTSNKIFFFIATGNYQSCNEYLPELFCYLEPACVDDLATLVPNLEYVNPAVKIV